MNLLLEKRPNEDLSKSKYEEHNIVYPFVVFDADFLAEIHLKTILEMIELL